MSTPQPPKKRLRRRESNPALRRRDSPIKKGPRAAAKRLP